MKMSDPVPMAIMVNNLAETGIMTGIFGFLKYDDFTYMYLTC
jgi:hypothetical protein